MPIIHRAGRVLLVGRRVRRRRAAPVLRRRARHQLPDRASASSSAGGWLIRRPAARTDPGAMPGSAPAALAVGRLRRRSAPIRRSWPSTCSTAIALAVAALASFSGRAVTPPPGRGADQHRRWDLIAWVAGGAVLVVSSAAPSPASGRERIARRARARPLPVLRGLAHRHSRSPSCSWRSSPRGCGLRQAGRATCSGSSSISAMPAGRLALAAVAGVARRRRSSRSPPPGPRSPWPRPDDAQLRGVIGATEVAHRPPGRERGSSSSSSACRPPTCSAVSTRSQASGLTLRRVRAARLLRSSSSSRSSPAA